MFYNESSTSPWFQAKVIYAVNSSKSCIHQVVLVSAFDREYLFEVLKTMSVLILRGKGWVCIVEIVWGCGVIVSWRSLEFELLVVALSEVRNVALVSTRR